MNDHELKAPSIEVSAARPPFFAGVDLGGTNIKLGILDRDGQTVVARSFPTQGELGPAAAMQRSAEQLQIACQQIKLRLNEVVCVGLATPGTMDIPAGMLLEPPNLPKNWHHFAIRDALAKQIQKKVIYANDANAAAFGEFWIGSGREFASVVFLTLGTGVGAGIIVDGGFPLDGQHSHGGECGHIIIDSTPDARRCGCGQRGHLEAYCSATALVKQAGQQLAAGTKSALGELAAQGEPITALGIAESADAGDSLSLDLIRELATHLGRGMVTIAHTVDPAAMILGGAMNFGGPGTKLGDLFLSHVSDTFRQLAFPVLAEQIQIRFAKLGGDAGYVGAAGIARRDYFRSTSEG